ncbi:hypothetical protein SAMN02982989_1060 [Xaviernesmea oryzae]|uniref:Uncharacterized protein n=1 Tax=Xaviernesmea oryzae TaxID=464029 RepID=A0A1X7FXB5_9HYPH|nr:hypothetical protein SAMN02982989_1060 [Xaviernesmea oryzae]
MHGARQLQVRRRSRSPMAGASSCLIKSRGAYARSQSNPRCGFGSVGTWPDIHRPRRRGARALSSGADELGAPNSRRPSDSVSYSFMFIGQRARQCSSSTYQLRPGPQCNALQRPHQAWSPDVPIASVSHGWHPCAGSCAQRALKDVKPRRCAHYWLRAGTGWHLIDRIGRRQETKANHGSEWRRTSGASGGFRLRESTGMACRPFTDIECEGVLPPS